MAQRGQLVQCFMEILEAAENGARRQSLGVLKEENGSMKQGRWAAKVIVNELAKAGIQSCQSS